MSHNHMGHYYMSHNYKSHNYKSHNYMSHNYMSHNYIGRSHSIVRRHRRVAPSSLAGPASGAMYAAVPALSVASKKRMACCHD